jgi:Fur family ferric uptake transcriptional regulator
VKKASDIIQRRVVERGFSKTAPRRLVLEVFLKDERPLTPAAVHAQLPDRNINLTSVYRAIELFCRLGVLTEVDHVPEGRRYELSDDYREHHHHLICGNCGKTEDFEDCEMEEIEKLIKRRFQFKVTRHELRFLGLCRRCQR